MSQYNIAPIVIKAILDQDFYNNTNLTQEYLWDLREHKIFYEKRLANINYYIKELESAVTKRNKDKK